MELKGIGEILYIFIYDSQIVHHNPCFNLFILHNVSFDNQGNEINKNDIFLRFDILTFYIYRERSKIKVIDNPTSA